MASPQFYFSDSKLVKEILLCCNKEIVFHLKFWLHTPSFTVQPMVLKNKKIKSRAVDWEWTLHKTSRIIPEHSSILWQTNLVISYSGVKGLNGSIFQLWLHLLQSALTHVSECELALGALKLLLEYLLKGRIFFFNSSNLTPFIIANYSESSMWN